MSAATAAPVGAVSTTTITSARCDVAALTISVTWSGKTPYSWEIAWNNSLGIAGRAEGLVPKPNDNSVTFTASSISTSHPATIRLFGKPHGNTEVSYPYHGALKDEIVIPCA